MNSSPMCALALPQARTAMTRSLGLWLGAAFTCMSLSDVLELFFQAVDSSNWGPRPLTATTATLGSWDTTGGHSAFHTHLYHQACSLLEEHL